MKKKVFKYWLIVFAFIAPCSNSLLSQDVRILDSLKNVLKNKTLPDTQRIATYGIISNFYIASDIDKCLAYADSMRQLSAKIKYKKGMVVSLLSMGNAYLDKADYKKAMESFLLGEKNYDSTKVGIEKLAGIYNSIGVVYARLDNYYRALDYYNKSLNIAIRTKNKRRIAAGYNNVGTIYTALKNYDSSAYFAKKALLIKLEIGDLKGIGSSYANVATAFFGKQQYDSSNFYYNKASIVYEQLGDKLHLGMMYKNKGICLIRTSKFVEAITLYERSLAIANELGDKEGIKSCYEALAEAYAGKMDYKKAYEYHMKFTSAKDSISNTENKKIVSELETKYESEIKDKKLLMQENQIKLEQAAVKEQSLQRNSFIGASFFLLIVALLAFVAFRQKRNANMIINEQKSKLEGKQKEIIDSMNYASRIQKTLLTNEKYIDRNIKRLKENTKE